MNNKSNNKSNIKANNYKSTSFTLIELLVVVAIMGLLAVMGIIAFNHVQAKARDAKREADLEAIATAMELSMTTVRSYPDTTSSTYCLETACSGTPESFCSQFQTYMPDIPSDPLNGSSRDYCYLFSSDGSNYRIAAVMEKNDGRMSSDGGLYSYFLEQYSDFSAIDMDGWSSSWNGGDVPGYSVWTCGDTLSYEGQDYTTISIGDQCWFAEHLNVGTMTAGVNDQGTSCSSIDKYCYSDTESYCTSDGALYQWDQAMCGSTTPGDQGICPSGWHIPTDDEYKTLEMYLGMSQAQADATGWRGTDEGTKLKVGGSSGFEGLLAGYRSTTDGSFDHRSTYADVWSSLESGGNVARALGSGYAAVYRNTYDKLFGFSVRCLQD